MFRLWALKCPETRSLHLRFAETGKVTTPQKDSCLQSNVYIPWKKKEVQKVVFVQESLNPQLIICYDEVWDNDKLVLT
jgi:hypothetical protein